MSAQTVLRLREFEWCDIPAQDLVAEDGELRLASREASKFFNTRLTSSGLRLQALGFIGLLPLTDAISVDVRPRVPVGNLSRLMEVSKIVPERLAGVTRRYLRHGELYPSLVGMYAEALVRSVAELSTLGLLREYERRETITSTPHGRIMAGRAMQTTIPRGETYRIPISWFQRTIDIPANRCIRFALWRLAQINHDMKAAIAQREYQRTARMLNGAFNALDGVELDLSGMFLSDAIVTGRRDLPTNRRYYRPALDLALAVIEGSAVKIEHSDEGPLELPSLVIRMSDVFEAYLRELLIDAARSQGWTHRVLDGNKRPPNGAAKRNLLHSGVEHEATPDIVLQRGSRKAPQTDLVIEVKYKPAGTRIDRDDLNQTLAYGISYGAQNVVVAQPRAGGGAVAGLREIGTFNGMGVWLAVVDLADEDLLQVEQRFASDIGTLLASA